MSFYLGQRVSFVIANLRGKRGHGVASKTAVKRSKLAISEDSFVGLPLFAFSYPGVADVDLHYQSPDDSTMHLLCDRRRGLASNELNELTNRGIQCLFVHRVDYDTVAASLYANLDEILVDTRHPAGQRLVLIQAAACDPLSAAYRLISSDQYVSICQRIGNAIGRLILEYKHSPLQLFNVLQHGDSHAVHVTNVAAYSSLLLQMLGNEDLSDNVQIAVAAMLHDVSLRRKRGDRDKQLTWADAHEFDLHRDDAYPKAVYEELCERRDVTRDQLLMLYQHHERIDGMGGPVGLVGDEIHCWARILSLVDTFDALTSDRQQRPRQPITNTLALLGADAGNRFDAGLVSCWIKAFQTS